MKKLICAIMAAAMLLCLCACGHSPADGATFSSVLSDKGLSVENLGSSGMDGVKDCYVAYNDDMSIVIFFYITNSESDAQRAFNNAKAEFDSMGGSSTNVSSGSYARATRTSGEVFYIAAYSGATFMYGETSKDQASQMKDLFKALGY